MDSPRDRDQCRAACRDCGCRELWPYARTRAPAREAQWSATLIPLSVDGMVVAASMSVLLASKMGRRGEWLPWALLIVGSLASLAANVAIASPTTVSRLIAAWPSFAFVGAYHLLQSQLRIGRVDLIAPIEERQPILRTARWMMAPRSPGCWRTPEDAFSSRRGRGPIVQRTVSCP
jgi:Protein of unknown function (DUF2637)